MLVKMYGTVSGSTMRCCKSEVFVHEGALGGYQ
jgi:hypothetical protein